MLAMDEAAPDIYRRAQEPLNAQCIKPNRCADSIDDRVDRAQFMELHILGRHMMNLSFRYRQFRKDRGCYPFRIRRETAVTNHRKNFRCFALEVTMGELMAVMMMRVILLPCD